MPVLVVVEKENNKAIIVDIASPWGHRLYEKGGEKIEKYQELKREIGRLWEIRHLEVVPVVSKRQDAWLEKLGVTIRTGLLQKTALLGTARILRKLLELAEGEEMTQRTFGHGSLFWCNVGITSAGAKAFHLHNNNNNNNDNNNNNNNNNN